MDIIRRQVLGVLAATLPLGRASAQGQVPIKLGILTDMSGPYRDIGGPLIEPCVRQAILDSGVAQRGITVEVLTADHQNKVDVGLSIVRQWFDVQGVDAVIDLGNSALALAVAPLAREKDKVQLNTGAGLSDLTGRACTPNLIHWTFDTWQMSHSICDAMVARGLDTWFFIVADYAFGHSTQRDSEEFVRAAGGQVLGAVRHPFPSTTDFSSFLLQAQASRAKVIGLANSGSDLVNCVKQAAEFGVTRRGAKLAALVTFINDIHAIGLQHAQGLALSDTFYWDLDERTRAFTAKVRPHMGTMVPTSVQAGAYSGVLHYLKLVQEMGVQRAKASGRAVVEAMKRLPTDDDAFGQGRIREDGRKIHPSYLFEVKAPAESSGPWDYFKLAGTTPLERAFRSMELGGCPLVNKT
jgi:branched-chain amino acid transport system substrate-binding protein